MLIRHVGAERFEEALAYIEKHQLYDDALDIWRGTEKYDVSQTPILALSCADVYRTQTVLSIYGDWLFERREFSDAAFSE